MVSALEGDRRGSRGANFLLQIMQSNNFRVQKSIKIAALSHTMLTFPRLGGADTPPPIPPCQGLGGIDRVIPQILVSQKGIRGWRLPKPAKIFKSLRGKSQKKITFFYEIFQSFLEIVKLFGQISKNAKEKSK